MKETKKTRVKARSQTFANVFLDIFWVLYLFFVVPVTDLAIPLLSFFSSLHLQFQRTSRHNAWIRKTWTLRGKIKDKHILSNSKLFLFINLTVEKRCKELTTHPQNKTLKTSLRLKNMSLINLKEIKSHLNSLFSPLPLGKATPDSASNTELFPELWSPITAIAGSAKSFSTPRERSESIRSMQGRTFCSNCSFKLFMATLMTSQEEKTSVRSSGRNQVCVWRLERRINTPRFRFLFSSLLFLF